MIDVKYIIQKGSESFPLNLFFIHKIKGIYIKYGVFLKFYTITFEVNSSYYF